jgi:hypothetical protein
MTTKTKRWAKEVKPPQPLLNPPGLFQARRDNLAPTPPSEEYEIPGLALTCQKCNAPVDAYDATGGAWCDGCLTRMRLINQGFYASWPAARSGRVVIPAGRVGWLGFAKGAPEAVIAALLGTAKGRAA